MFYSNNSKLNQATCESSLVFFINNKKKFQKHLEVPKKVCNFASSMNDKQNKLIKIITIMKKSIIIITVITLAVISIIVFSDKDKFSAIVERHNAQCEMYNKVCNSEDCEIDSLVRTFPKEYIILTIGEDGKVSEVKVPNDNQGLETMINEIIDDNEFWNNQKKFDENQKKFDEWLRASIEFSEYLDLGGEIDYKIVYPNNSKKGVKTKELNNFLNSKAKLIEYVYAYFNALYENAHTDFNDVKYKTICKVIKKKFITDDNLNIQYNYNEDTNTITFEVINN